MTLFDKLKFIEQNVKGNYWADRIASELLYAAGISKTRADRYNGVIENTANYLLSKLEENHSVVKNDALKAEEMLADCKADCKALTAHCISHAHIDMNWMWGYQETAAVTVDTLRTILNLMKEYPEFTYAQSQASVYRIIEDYAPEMLGEIKERIHEGRWELSASTWVETDKNMPNGESLSRHILYTKRYLSKLFDISPDSLRLDFEPDTFGHNINVPEILQNGGVDYYYHCRGYDKEFIYNWKSPSGKSILVYREPKWYNADINSSSFCDFPIFCEEYGIDCFLKVYGVGDHGGGPTRRDVERIIDMSQWPLYPTIRFSTYGKFFKALEKYRDKFAVVESELNFVFTGCYTTQTRVKMSNRISEDRLYDSEMLSAAANVLTGASAQNTSFEKAWRNVMFNHFHDIIPGSGVIETREYALGLFQDTMARTNTNMNTAMRGISDSIDTSTIGFSDAELKELSSNNTVSEGGGVGFAVSHKEGHMFPQTERGRGKTRIIHLFNSTQYDRCEPVEVTVWDYTGDMGKVAVVDGSGNPVRYFVSGSGQHYWGHNFTKFIIDAGIPAFGYSTYVIKETSCNTINAFVSQPEPRCDYMGDDPLVLENEYIRAVFNSETALIESLTDKETGKVLITPDNPSAIFRFIKENTRYGSTAWRVGPYMQEINLNKDYPVKVTDYRHEPLRKYFKYSIEFFNSKLDVSVTLNDRSKLLDFNVTVDWHETGSPNTFIPQLNFCMPVAYTASGYKYDVPFGILERVQYAHDVPANSFIEVLNSDSGSKSVFVVTDTKYGYRGYGNSGAVTLIRGSYDPDPYPELGIHHIRLGVGLCCGSDNCMKKLAACYVHPISFASDTKHTGKLPLIGSLLKVSDNVQISSVKNAEEDGVIVRLYNISGECVRAKLDFCSAVSDAELVDITELHEVGKADVSGNSVEFNISKYSIATLRVSFKA